jgi:hypothetical protein
LAVISAIAFRHAGPTDGERDLVAGMHDVAHEFEHRAEPAAGMEMAEVDGGEAAALQERDRQRVAERGLHQGRGGGREIVRAGLARLRHRQHDVGGAPSVLSVTAVTAMSPMRKRRE